MENMNRRKFLGYLGTGAAALAAASAGLGTLAPVAGAAPADHLFKFPNQKKTKKAHGFFKPIQPTMKDDLVLPEGFKYDVVAAYGDVINKKGDTFGFNADFTLYFPINGSSEDGLLWVNHEYTQDVFVQGKKGEKGYTAEQVEKLLYNQGGSIIRVQLDKKSGKWKMITDSEYARRITGLTPFVLTGAAAGSPAVKGATKVQGTFANCSGGMTLWNTVLSCEENWENTAADAGLDTTHYGWVIEVDPFDVDDQTFPVRKHTALGRFHHENTAMGLSKDGRVVVYMGDDKTDACVYKYVSNGKYVESAGRGNSKLLEDGILYVANFAKGKWIPVTIETVQDAIKKAKKDELLQKFQTQADVLVNCAEAAILVGGTPTDRPEDLEISPFDGTIFIAHTNNDKHGNIHGHITRFFEKDGDHGSLDFDFEIFAAGGRQSGFSAPDNLSFDSNGNLWTVTDISSSKLGKDAWKSFGNNGLFVIPTTGSNAGEAFQFASGPVEAELTGPWFTPDEKTLFLAVQHPGEETEDVANPTSRWPRYGNDIPRPAVVAITGFKF
ncbi:PhoX family phosphatase [Ammoniphilus sp. YIM 78166]|uniref:PhoX family protein n=1 Tax=Ammoniphilus sp. YIM 78166 TaxID=1644106 RepID=UPI00106FC394|nr:alkaline phosphatase PhoX [Ammoniphilus sp. YIM 78166]